MPAADNLRFDGSGRGERRPVAISATQAAIVIGAVVAVVAAIGYEVLALSYAVGGRGAMSGMWRAELGQLTRAGLLLGSVVAFALALRARTGGQSRALLWLPLATLPVMLTMGLGLGALLA